MTDELVTQSSHTEPEVPVAEAADPDPSTDTPTTGTDPSRFDAATPTPSRIHGRHPTPGGTGGAPPKTGRAGFKNHPPTKSPAPRKFTAVLSQKQIVELTRVAKQVHRLRERSETLAVWLRNARLRAEAESKRVTGKLLDLVADMGKLEKQVRAQMGPVKRRVAAPKNSGGAE